MTLPPTRGWRIDLALWAPLLIFAAGLLCMKLAPLLTLPAILALLYLAPPFGRLKAEIVFSPCGLDLRLESRKNQFQSL